MDIDSERPRGIFIPSGVAHGYLALTDATIIYVVDQYYDGGKDEFGVTWDDPDIGLAWGIEAAEVTLSERDLANPSLRDLDDADLPA
jgi:dTDP-4-dehydrorhamnose 3,5-epimerase